MRKVWGALLGLALIGAGIAAGVPKVSAAGNYTVSIADATAVEGSPLALTVSSVPVPAAGDVLTVRVTTSPGTANSGTGCPGGDFIGRSADVVLTPTSPTAAFNVQTCDDNNVETSETVNATFGNLLVGCNTVATPCAIQAGDGVAVGTITDNEPGPNAGPSILNVVDVTGRSGPDQNCTFNVNRAGGTAGTSTVNYQSFGRPKLVANVAGTLTFAPGETVKSIAVDVLKRPRRQRFVTLNLSAATNATVDDGSALCELKTKHKQRRRHR